MKDCYYSFNNYLREKFGERVHKINLNASFACPNRDGTFSSDGCIFCNEKGLLRSVKRATPLEKQIEESMDFARKRFKAGKFIAYFQNAANTYADTGKLKKAYDAIKAFPEIAALFISTRPDCIDKEKLDLIESYSDDYEVWIEYGLQSVHDATLKKINRSHTFSQSLKAIEETSKRKIHVGAHIILGLPGESRDDMMETAKTLATLPISGVKLHVFHVLCDTKAEDLFNKGEIKLLEHGEYARLACDFLEELHPKCVILRLVSEARHEVLLAPEWMCEKRKIINDIKNEFKKRGTYQGAHYAEKSLCIR
jgi:radical SAM protein (TIGR01212 family)